MRIFISAPDRSINFINQRTLIAGTQRLAFDLMRLGRRNVNRVALFEWEFSNRNVQRTRKLWNGACWCFRSPALDATNCARDRSDMSA